MPRVVAQMRGLSRDRSPGLWQEVVFRALPHRPQSSDALESSAHRPPLGGDRLQPVSDVVKPLSGLGSTSPRGQCGGVAVWAYFDRGQSARNPSQEAIFWSVWSCTNRSPETGRRRAGLWAFPGSSCWGGGPGSGRCLCCPRVVLSSRFLLAGTVAVRTLMGWAGLGQASLKLWVPWLPYRAGSCYNFCCRRLNSAYHKN